MSVEFSVFCCVVSLSVLAPLSICTKINRTEPPPHVISSQEHSMESKPASDLQPAELAALVNLGFTGYMGRKVEFSPEELTLYCSNNFISLPRSHVFFLKSDPSVAVAFGLIAAREDKPKEVRLASMAVIPSAKGKGIGSQALAIIIEAEKTRGTSVFELEAIQTNTPAVNLYKRAGFSIHRELLGWERDIITANQPDSSTEPLQECSISDVDALVKAHGSDDLPWQIWGFSRGIAAARAFKLDHAYCVISDPDDEKNDTISMKSLIVEPNWRSQGQARNLIQALMSRFPNKKWFATPLFPKEYAESLAKTMGFSNTALNQYQMRMKLD